MNKQEIQLLNKLDISPNDFQHEFGAGAVSRGLKYYKSNKVMEVTSITTSSYGNVEISGLVSGSGQFYYNTEVEIDKYPYGVDVSSFCSCPVGGNCKHGVALLFTYLNNLDEEKTTKAKEQDQIDHWLDALESLEQQSLSTIAEVNSKAPSDIPHVLYLLNFSEQVYSDNESGLYVSVVKSRLLKKGGYGRDYFIKKYSDLSTYSDNPYSTELDEKIADSLKGLSQSTYSYYYELEQRTYLKGELGELLIKQLLETGRCFWQTQKSHVLSNGKTRKVILDWKESDKLLVPDFQCNPPINNLFKIEGLHYLDIENSNIGIIKHDSLNSQQLIYLLSAPPITKKKAKAVSERLLNILPEADIPLPAKINIKNIDIKNTPPIFHLKLHATSIGEAEAEHLMHVASLSFQYDQVFCKPKLISDLNKKTSVTLENLTRYRIHRQNDLEKKAIDRLHEENGITSLESEEAKFGILDFTFIGENSISDSVLNWDNFRNNTLPLLEEQGWKIDIDDSFLLEIEEVDEWSAELEESEGGEWFEMSLGFEINGKTVNMLPLLVNLLASSPDTKLLTESLKQKKHQLLQLDAHQWVKIPTKRILLVLDTVIELYDKVALNKDGNLEFSKHAGLHYGSLLNDPSLCWKGADELKALNDKLHNFDGIQSVPLPNAVNATLRDYQKSGYDWLQFLREYQLNGILADDMGLGKTLQALSSLLKEKQEGRAELPSLVIAPTSLMSNWRQEVERFTPDIKVLTLQGMDRKEKFSQILDYDLILTTYPLMMRDTEFYQAQKFHLLILDEAQAIKNARSKTTQIIYSLKANHRLCLTGTPIENHLGELWSMFHFLMPGYLGTQEKFTRLFRTPIEKNADETRGEQLRKRIQPFMLRRTKDLVAKELPKKTEIINKVSLSGKQRDLYETVRLAMDKKVRDEISKKGLARSHIMILDALLKLRQVCCDPQLVKLAKAKTVKESAKLEMLMEMVPEMVNEGRKILIFSQFTSMLSIIEKQLKHHKITYSKLTGQTRKREEAISAFQEGDAKVFLISLKAGGVGLNLTAADTVIHYDPWWNPAVENQATDRAYRIGQNKPVFVYKLLTEDTVEEKILKLQEKKQQLADGMYGGKAKKGLAFGQTELMDLLKPLE